jgi:ABC-type transporter Mla subunit MlaD
MPRTIHWSDLRVGILSAIGLAGLLLIILLFARVGGLRGEKATIYIVAADATGVLTGTDIWLAGQKIGAVRDVRFRPVSVDTSQRLLIEAQILAARLSPIRRDSRAEIRPGTSMIGIPVVLKTGRSQ